MFGLAMVNTDAVTCLRDLDAALQEVLVMTADGQGRLWSSNDCFPGDTDDVRLGDLASPPTAFRLV